jgi:hypothetical protein
VKCEQQKCLVHLIRDFNYDIQGSPWDEELKSLGGAFGRLLRTIVATIDVYGLKARHLGKHRREIDRFFLGISEESYRSGVAEGYRKRLIKCRDKLFTFVHHDGVPWNNNAAEHAVKKFARYRQLVDGRVGEMGLKQYLILLSIQQTCKCKGVSFLKFLLSREQDIDVFCRNRGARRPAPAVEFFPDGWTSSRQSRKRNWDEGHQRDDS